MPTATESRRPRPAASNNEKARARELLATEIDFVANDFFRSRKAEAEILGERLPATDADASAASNASRRDLPAHLSRLCEAPLLTAEEERQLFRRMNYLKYRANALRCKLDPENFDVDTLRQAEDFLGQSQQIRDRIVHANMRLVVSVVKKFVTPQLSFDEMLSDGIVTLMNAVEKFDYDRGFRFSTYAYRSIARNAYRAVMDRQKENHRYVNGEDSVSEVIDQGGTSSMDEKTWETLRTLLSKMMHRLDDREQLILKARYALGKNRQMQTFQRIADRLGVSKERVRQLEQRAVGKLKAMADDMQLDEMLAPTVQ